MLLNIEPINEVYFGKTPEMQRIENQLGKFRSKYIENYIGAPLVNNDPDLLKYNRMMEEYFGFGCFSLSIIQMPAVNAYTTPISSTFDTALYQKNLIVDKNHFKFNPKANYTCLVYVYSGVIFNPEFTTEECMAIIMHEVGHNFYYALSGGFGVMNKLIYTMIFLRDIIVLAECGNSKRLTNYIIDKSNTIRTIKENLNRYYKEHMPILADIFGTVEYFFNLLDYAKGIPNNILDKATLGLLKIYAIPTRMLMKAANPYTWILLPIDLNDEKTADNFATMYGYGPALTSSLDKLRNSSPSKIDQVYNNIPIASTIYEFNNSINHICMNTFDSHPETITRVQDQLDMLKREVNKEDLDPKMRKAILSDIAACEKEIKQLTKLDNGINDPHLVSKVWNIFIYDNFKSKRIKDMIFNNRSRFDLYDTTYDNKL